MKPLENVLLRYYDRSQSPDPEKGRADASPEAMKSGRKRCAELKTVRLYKGVSS